MVPPEHLVIDFTRVICDVVRSILFFGLQVKGQTHTTILSRVARGVPETAPLRKKRLEEVSYSILVLLDLLLVICGDRIEDHYGAGLLGYASPIYYSTFAS